MLTNKSQPVPVRARLKIDMIVDGDAHEAGDVVDLSARDFKYLNNLDRVELAQAGKK